MQTAPVFLTAIWRYLVMVNYAVEPETISPLVPPGTTLDLWGGRTFLSLVGFRFLDTRVRGLAIPFHRNFDEINLRFYVKRQIGNEVRRGVAFVREIVPRRGIAAAARLLYNENYVTRPTRSILEYDEDGRGVFEYSWHDRERVHRIRITVGDGEGWRLPTEGSEEQFIAEHYWGYATQRDGSLMEYAVEHEPWRIRSGTDVRVEVDVETCYGRRYAGALGRTPTSAFVAEGSSVVVRKGSRVRR